ncbi:MAG TPA: hypothetical protein VIM07_07030 [Chitinophagaceae bacterium]
MNKKTIVQAAALVVIFLLPAVTPPVSLATTNVAHVQTSINRGEHHDHTRADRVDRILDLGKGLKVYGNLNTPHPIHETTYVQFATLATLVTITNA